MSLVFPSTSPSFLSLPPDLHILVLSLLPPRSIITIRQTCKALRAFAELRTVWLTALKRICLANAVPFVTYNFERMTREELEYAASMPDHFKHAGRAAYSKTGIPMIHAIKERRLPIPLPDVGSDEFLQEGSEVHGIAVIPGGRFVLGRTEDALILWDLNKSSNKPCSMLHGDIDAYPGSSLADAAIKCAYLAHYPEESKVRIFVSAFRWATACNVCDPATYTAFGSLRDPDEDEDEHACIVYELNLAAEPPTFTPINHMDGVVFMGFAGSRERIIVKSISDDLVGIWDVEQNTAVSWNILAEDVDRNIPAATDYHVIHARECHLAAYRLPPSQPCNGTLPAPSRLQLVQEMDCFEPHISDAMTCMSTSYSSSCIGDFVVVEVTVNDVDAMRLVKRLSVRSTPDNTPIGPPCVLTDDDIVRVAAPKQGADTVTAAYELSDLMRGELMVNIAPLEELTPGQTIYLKRKRGRFFPQNDEQPWNRGEYDICAVTGRVCVGRMDKNMLLVCDFVPPFLDSRPDLEFYASTPTF